MRSILLVLPLLALAVPAVAQDHDGHDMMDMPMPGVDRVATMPMPMRAALGAYPMTREASGTSWQPDASTHDGVHRDAGGWMLMGHAMLDLVGDHQSGPRGDGKLFAAGMAMGMATRALSDRDTLQLRAMVSPDPLMGQRGYPLLLATGETADGMTPLIDRQHPHDLFMELSAAASRRIGARGSVFAYFGLPGEPAFGPPAFMHRASVMDSPEAPISHHWLDSTHISFGVATAGVTWGPVKLEASRFKGREPDQHRYDIERPKFDSTAGRLSWNPNANIALQASWARQKSPEQIEPAGDQEKWSASALYARRIGRAGRFAATLAWGRRTRVEPGGVHGPHLNAFAAEASWKPDARWAAFARLEHVENDELVAGGHGPAYRVAKASIGGIRDFALSSDVKLGLGALAARTLTPDALDPLYGGDRTSGMAFVRLKIG